MRVLIQTLGSGGDTHPFTGVGEAVRKMGRDVVLFGNEVFSNAVERAGPGCGHHPLAFIPHDIDW